ncbi:unnamed protein product [Anisakis simplex]|uniref:DB domain-containing protein n=1 Tax=Anisakis simplex TaxID=6269 RepID=A0A0M3JYT6_ANISI|nr:unnamed protein product [Anisakis simplex]
MSPHEQLISFLFAFLLIERAFALRCKCTTSKGISKCVYEYCDVHATSEKRAACAVVRVEQQTHFACVLIKHTSNDTFCHMIRSATACWCRDVDFCNVDLEARLVETVKSIENDNGDGNALSYENSNENESDNDEQQTSFVEAEEVPHDIFDITATRLDDMKEVELKAATELDSFSHLNVTAARNSKPTFSPEDYLYNYADEIDQGFVYIFFESFSNHFIFKIFLPTS